MGVKMGEIEMATPNALMARSAAFATPDPFSAATGSPCGLSHFSTHARHSRRTYSDPITVSLL
jgi:hypothetical protein